MPMRSPRSNRISSPATVAETSRPGAKVARDQVQSLSGANRVFWSKRISPSDRGCPPRPTGPHRNCGRRDCRAAPWFFLFVINFAVDNQPVPRLHALRHVADLRQRVERAHGVARETNSRGGSAASAAYTRCTGLEISALIPVVSISSSSAPAHAISSMSGWHPPGNTGSSRPASLSAPMQQRSREPLPAPKLITGTRPPKCLSQPRARQPVSSRSPHTA